MKSILGLHRFFAVSRLDFARKVISQALITAAFLLAPAISFAAPVGNQSQRVNGHIPRITRKLSPVGRLNAGAQMDVTIGLPLRNREQLTNLLEDIYNPSSPNYRHFLTPDQFTASFAPTVEDYQSVIDFAKAHHLTVTHTHPNRTLVHVKGSVADIENTFHVHMRTYRHPKENRTFFAADAEPSLDLKTPVLAISGLDNYVRPHPHIHSVKASPRIPLGGGGGGGGGSGGNAGPFQGYDFRYAYVPNLSQDGTGQSIGLFELFGFSQQDIMDYEDESGIPYVNVQPVEIDGGTADDSQADWTTYPGYLDYAVEVTGDIETAIAMAPGVSSVLVYIGPTPLDVPPIGSSYIQDATTTAQINDVLNRMATDNLAKQLSCSYGFDINLSTVQIFQQMAAQGQSFFLASGDFGAFSSAVDEPADDPYITTVGGTTLVTSATTGERSSEVVWTAPPGTDAFTGAPTPPLASGGGVSMAYAIPWWQQGISMTANQGSTTMRNVPDVSLVASNIVVTWGTDFFLQSVDFPEAGTSLAAPLWAGFMAMVNQQAAANGQPPIGFVNPALYAIGKSTNYASCFHDITSGANTNNASPTKYKAVAGYDLCTGWGTISTNLFDALLAPPVETLRVTSPLGFTSFGASGGPFSVASRTYTLANTGAVPLTWSLINTSSWLNVSSSGGTLNPGSNTTVTVSLNANVNQFMITHASGNVTFNNLTAGTMQNRQFDLYVGNGGFENGDLSDWTHVGDPTLTFALAGDDADVAGQQALPGQSDTLFVHSGIYGGYLGQWPDDGSLSQTVPTSAGQKLLVSFWLTSVPDQDGSNAPNDFAAKWDGTTLFTGTDLPTFGWTNMQYVVSAPGASGTLEFDFNNTPGAFGLDDVTVQTIPQPVLNSTMVAGGNLSFSWNAIPNVSYLIQSSTALDGSSGWTNVGNPIVATNTVMNISVPIGTAPEGFYRVIMQP
ncbi:MAG TPA: protease pro-enzyme activation domain-containing protein [Candidatus Polarisedimenticolia bacterium]|nr:protease pro-enzyme activation domain-containing protein [Candidatus Polarisedimenticolia bacterium]